MKKAWVNTPNTLIRFWWNLARSKMWIISNCYQKEKCQILLFRESISILVKPGIPEKFIFSKTDSWSYFTLLYELLLKKSDRKTNGKVPNWKTMHYVQLGYTYVMPKNVILGPVFQFPEYLKIGSFCFWSVFRSAHL